MNEYDTIIIGAGTAGLTAAIYLRRASKKVLVLEAKSYGGQIVNSARIENYPAEANISGYEFAEKIYNQALDFGATILFEKVVKIESTDACKIVTTTNNRYIATTVILATGSDNRKLNVDGEEEYLGKGVSYCATCDGSFYKDKEVAIVGGGETAIEDALYLSNIASKVYLIHRRDTFKVSDELLESLKKKINVEYVLNSNITKISGEDVLTNIDVSDTLGNMRNIKISGLFIAVGRIPENQNFANVINLDVSGYVIASEDCHTNVPGIFVAGDARTKSLRQLVTATSDGAVAATEAIKFINENKRI